MSINHTQWVSFNGCSEYLISSCGQVLSLKFNKIKKLKTAKNSKGYISVGLSIKNKVKRFSVHRLVGEHFLDNKNNKKCINHKDGKKDNNNIGNLEWVTYKENIDHAYTNKLTGLGENHARSKLKNWQVREIINAPKKVSNSFLATRYNVSKSTVRHIRKRRTWRHMGDIDAKI